MKQVFKIMTALSLCTLVLAGCAGDETIKRKGNGTNDIFMTSDIDGTSTLNYNEFKRFAYLEAAGAGPDAVNRRNAEQMSGNRELHKRFVFLDHDNNGQISLTELGEY